MYFLQNFFIWIRKYFIRILLGEYPNFYLKASSITNHKRKKNIYLISSTDNFWVSKSMCKKWQFYSENIFNYLSKSSLNDAQHGQTSRLLFGNAHKIDNEIPTMS